jgi:hypothetical protein
MDKAIDKAKPNEVWKDADGCLYTPEPHGDGWLAFGSYATIVEGENKLLTLPMERVFDEEGNYVLEGKLYK